MLATFVVAYWSWIRPRAMTRNCRAREDDPEVTRLRRVSRVEVVTRGSSRSLLRRVADHLPEPFEDGGGWGLLALLFVEQNREVVGEDLLGMDDVARVLPDLLEVIGGRGDIEELGPLLGVDDRSPL